VDAEPDWGVLEQFLGGLRSPREDKSEMPYFPERRSILPGDG
jgi:hypothetical protein